MKYVLITMPLFLVFSHQIAALVLTLFFMVLKQSWFGNFPIISYATAIAKSYS